MRINDHAGFLKKKIFDMIDRIKKLEILLIQ